MRSTDVTTQPDEDEDQPRPPFQWWSGGAVFSLGMTGFIGAILGGLLGSLLGTKTGMPLLALARLGCGVVAGMALGPRDVRARIGRGQRTSAEPLPPLQPGVGSSTHIQVLPGHVTTAPARRDNVTTALARRVKCVAAHTGRVN